MQNYIFVVYFSLLDDISASCPGMQNYIFVVYFIAVFKIYTFKLKKHPKCFKYKVQSEISVL